MKKYYYNGPVYEFNKLIGYWTGSTTAESEKKARNNLTYQYKITHNKTKNSKITLPGSLQAV